MKTIITAVIVCLAVPAISAAGIGPDYSQWTVEMASSGYAWASLFVRPDGEGKPFTEAFEVNGGGNQIDATMIVVARDALGHPIVGIPVEDLWISSGDDGVVVCTGGRVFADAPTDADGRTTFSRPPRAGGYSVTGVRVFYTGDEITHIEYPISMNSPDLDGNGRVNLTDTGIWANDLFFGPYHYRSDFNGDGTINLTDAGFMGRSLGVDCGD